MEEVQIELQKALFIAMTDDDGRKRLNIASDVDSNRDSERTSNRQNDGSLSKNSRENQLWRVYSVYCTRAAKARRSA